MGKAKGAVLVALGIAAGIVIGSLPASSQQEQGQKAARVQIEALDLNKDDLVVSADLKRKGWSSGDTYMFRSPLLDANSRKPMGGIKVHCTALHVSKKGDTTVFLCDLESAFADGKIVSTGSFTFAPKVDGGETTITGGTGDYEGAAGTMTLKFNSNSTSLTYDFATP
jgi:hypothetical protein